MKCPNCNHDITQPTKFCPECGTKLPEQAPVTCKKPKNNKKLIKIAIISGICLAVLVGAFFILRAINPGCMFEHEPKGEEKIKNATCTEYARYRRVCAKCEQTLYETKGTLLEAHVYENIKCGKLVACKNCGGAEKIFDHELADGVCTRCKKTPITLQLPAIPLSVHVYDYLGDIEQTVQITQLEHSNAFVWGAAKVTFAAKRIYHENGNNYSAPGKIGWKVYDARGVVIDSGTAYTDGNIKVGETSYGSFSIDGVKEWTEGYRLEILSIS